MIADYAEAIAARINLRPAHVRAVVELFDEGNTVPFVARYRKERTGSMDEDQLRQVQDLIGKLRSLDERRVAILASIEEQGKLTPDLRNKIQSAQGMTELEDLYQPYKPKRRTRATIARERGLLPLAERIQQQARISQSLIDYAQAFVNKEVASVDEALAGARDIVAETISDHTEVRQHTRNRTMQNGQLAVEKIEAAEDDRSVFQVYYEFSSRLDRIRPYQVLAINRGEKEKVLRVRITAPEKDWREPMVRHFPPDQKSPFFQQLLMAMEEAAERLLLPAVERDVRRELSERAEKHAIHVFALNVNALLNQPPLSGYVVMGIDPGFRTGCKVAVVDTTGKLIATDTIYPHEPQKRWAEAKAQLLRLICYHKVTLFAIGNGTASRETEALVVELIKNQGAGLHYIITNEAGASVYSASPLAKAELPGLDVSLRGAVSIARRVQDPLAELVKIETKSIGVGLYQHDVNQKELEQALVAVVENTVNRVGVDINTASPALLAHVAGIGTKLAEKIISHRDGNGPFRSRRGIMEVPGLGPKAYEQSAGFLRIRDGDQPLDASAIHPESYGLAQRVLELSGIHMRMSPQEKQKKIDDFRHAMPLERLAKELDCGQPTLEDILEQLVRPGRDPREELPLPILRTDVLSMEQLTPGMVLKGTVRNVVDFGAFVDIGVKHDGLLHRTRIQPGVSLQVGDIVDIEVVNIEIERGRITLAMR